jgi:hypothetical protein
VYEQRQNIAIKEGENKRTKNSLFGTAIPLLTLPTDQAGDDLCAIPDARGPAIHLPDQ